MHKPHNSHPRDDFGHKILKLTLFSFHSLSPERNFQDFETLEELHILPFHIKNYCAHAQMYKLQNGLIWCEYGNGRTYSAGRHHVLGKKQ